MNQAKTILVLTPSIGGYYFGELLVGIAREVASAGGRLVVVQTLEAGTRYGERGEPGEVGSFDTPIAWSEVDGVVSVTTAVDGSYLQRLRDEGKPVVLAGAVTSGFAAPLALPDNHGGTYAAVEHLIGHGHRQIGFVGNLAQRDVHDRYVAYQQALDTHQLTADPALVFVAPNNARSGGVGAARELLRCARRPTAVMVATDRNAIGLMRTLRAAGLAIPRDIAVVAFDNTEAAVFSVPTLSSVDQRFDETGALAGRLVLAGLRGEDVPRTAFTSPAVVLAVRESCGCSTDPRDPQIGTEADAVDDSGARLRDDLQDVLCGAVLTGDAAIDAPLRDAVRAIVREAEHLVQQRFDSTAGELGSFMLSLRRLTSRPDVLRRVSGAVTRYVERRAATTARRTPAHRTRAHRTPGTDPAAGADRLAAALWQLQAGAFFLQAEATETALDEQFVVDAALLDVARYDPRLLGWLVGTHVRAGMLALWEGSDPTSGRLRVAGTFDPSSLLPDLVGTMSTPAHFPPETLIATARPADRDVCIVLPVRTTDRDWGLLALVGEIDTSSSREAYHHWAALLCASLDVQQMQETGRKNALYDALTGLPNRRLFLERLSYSLALWQRSATPFAVLFLDLDGFKLINDSLGHQMGDRVLTAVGKRIEQDLRDVDIGARFGGDEFAILLHDVSADAAGTIAERVLVGLAEVMDIDRHAFVVQASVGIATSAVEYTSAEDVLRDADAAMYHAKQRGQGSVSFFDTAMHTQAVRQQRLHVEIRKALEEQQFEMHYQPIVNLESGRTDRFEALVRWRHPERGLISPDEFLPGMTEGGLIVQLGHWIIEEVCRQLAAWGSCVASVSINVSDREFWHKDLLTVVLESLDRHDLTPDRLTLEITEAVLMRRPDVALSLMREMHDAGLRLHIDDFGAGHSSLETLRRFPVDAFKIDRSFISSLTAVDRTTELVSALVSMGKALGVGVVAEGIETGEQLAFLQEIGCSTGQGFLFMPAVIGEDAPGLLGQVLGNGRPVVVPTWTDADPPRQVDSSPPGPASGG